MSTCYDVFLRLDRQLTTWLCSPEDSEIEAKHLQRGELAVIETVWGHVAGGGGNAEDTEWMDGRIAKFLSQE